MKDNQFIMTLFLRCKRSKPDLDWASVASV
jgi:hypothetical protein